MMNATEFLALCLQIGFGLILAAVALAFLRLLRGPSLPDRVVALDLMTVSIVSFCGLYAMATRERAFLDVAMSLALVGFLATVALARFAERRQAGKPSGKEGT
ncbi:cation:proton antiporter [Actibacterium sp. MT2.3-13A]|uniref:monovalent cation/H+ antiporter complex subunit F n=1 Tax=Actibacterium sp. MT2.3-13A TaxID=2828332 RepID=UPI0020117EA2|nr:cation:proton antiporter [Actibacterium sp. MT2.3-13A]